MTDATTTPTDKAGEREDWKAVSEALHPLLHHASDEVWRRAKIAIDIAARNTHPHPSLSVGLDREAVAKIIEPEADHYIKNAAWAEDRKMWRGRKADAFAKADAILALAAPAEGYVLVPVLPTPNMIEAGQDPWLNKGRRQGWATVQAIYRAMIAACLPAAPTGETGT